MKNYLKSKPVNSKLVLSLLKTVSKTASYNFYDGPSESVAAYSSSLQFKAPECNLFYPILINISYLWKIDKNAKNLYESDTFSSHLE